MTLHRFMSEAEYGRLRGGKTLYNAVNHASERGKLTTSVGFCFFPKDPDDAIHWLSGCCDPEVCVTMEVPDHLVRESVGTYRDPHKDDLMNGNLFTVNRPTMRKREYCCIRYSIADGVKILSATRRFRPYAEIRRMAQMLGLAR